MDMINTFNLTSMVIIFLKKGDNSRSSDNKSITKIERDIINNTKGM